MVGNKKIYVAIACYRDPFIQSTIDDLFSKAAYPELITVGCFVQEKTEEKPLITNTYGNKVKVVSQIPGEVFSVCECRNLSLQFLDDEDFVLQIDSHTRFDEGWDKDLRYFYKSVNEEQALLSTGLPSFEAKPDGSENKHNLTEFRTFSFNNEVSKKIFKDCFDLVGISVHKPSLEKAINKDWYLCGHFIFGPSSFFREIKQPEWVGFWGEEIINSARAYTAGWNVYSLKLVPLYHLDENMTKTGRPRLWEDFPNQYFSNRITTTTGIIETLLGKRPENLFKERDLVDFYKLVGYNLGELFDSWRKEI